MGVSDPRAQDNKLEVKPSAKLPVAYLWFTRSSTDQRFCIKPNYFNHLLCKS